MNSKNQGPPLVEAGATIDRMRETFDRQRAAFRRDSAPSSAARRSRLEKLLTAVLKHKEDLASAVIADFGGRSWHETMVSILAAVDGIRYDMAHLEEWMRPRQRHVEPHDRPAEALIMYQPKGVVGVISPWNYPFTLSFVPLSTALAAGNRVMLKPSGITPATSDMMKNVLAEAFDDDLVATVTSGPGVAEAFSALPFDHIFFTGSPGVGRSVMRAAAENLTPVTLELGGKSPLIIHPDFPLAEGIVRIVNGKFMNAGQTCVAPDYFLVHESKVEELVSALRGEITRAYPAIKDNPDYAAIVNQRNHARLLGYLDDARAKGARIIEINPANEDFGGTRKIAPTLLLDVNEQMRIMQDEIFGPLLPILTYANLDEAVTFVNSRPRPLSLYYFDADALRARQILERTISGGACVNETVWHVLVHDLPFGGIGESGMGSYHGHEGFETFSHKKAVLLKPQANSSKDAAPPYGKAFEAALNQRLAGK